MIERVFENRLEAFDCPLISVVLPVYNGEQYLAEAIDSILTQSFRNFELIMIDDGSTDNSPNILKEYEQRDPRVRVIVRENRGLATTLNDSIDVARGKWIARMDQDDISLTHRLACQVAWLEKTGADLCGSWIQYFGAGDRRIWKTYESDAAIKLDMLFKCPIAHPTVMMKAEKIKKLKYESHWNKAEDYDLWVRASIAEWSMTNVQEVLLLYRRHPEQITSKNDSKQKQLTVLVQNRYWQYKLSEIHISNEEAHNVTYVDYCNYSTNQVVVEQTLEKLLSGNECEGKLAISQGAARICYNVAADHPVAAARLSKLMGQQDVGFPLKTKIILVLIFIFRIRFSGWMFIKLSRAYTNLHGSSRA